MKLFAHNIMKNNAKGVENGYPLKIDAQEVVVSEAEYNDVLVRTMIERLDYNVLKEAAEQVGEVWWVCCGCLVVEVV